MQEVKTTGWLPLHRANLRLQQSSGSNLPMQQKHQLWRIVRIAKRADQKQVLGSLTRATRDKDWINLNVIYIGQRNQNDASSFGTYHNPGL